MINMQSDATPEGERGRCAALSQLICGVYGIDAPWVWHLQRVVRKYGRDSFNNAEWVKAFVTEYINLVNKWEEEILTTTGEYLGYKVKVS